MTYECILGKIPFRIYSEMDLDRIVHITWFRYLMTSLSLNGWMWLIQPKTSSSKRWEKRERNACRSVKCFGTRSWARPHKSSCRQPSWRISGVWWVEIKWYIKGRNYRPLIHLIIGIGALGSIWQFLNSFYSDYDEIKNNELYLLFFRPWLTASLLRKVFQPFLSQ